MPEIEAGQLPMEKGPWLLTSAVAPITVLCLRGREEYSFLSAAEAYTQLIIKLSLIDPAKTAWYKKPSLAAYIGEELSCHNSVLAGCLIGIESPHEPAFKSA